MFIHKAIHDTLLFGNTCMAEDELINMVDVLSLVNYDTEKTGFEEQFEVRMQRMSSLPIHCTLSSCLAAVSLGETNSCRYLIMNQRYSVYWFSPHT